MSLDATKSICIYLQVHQPFRIKEYSIFDIGSRGGYFDSPTGSRTNNIDILHKVANKSYLPANESFLKMLKEHPQFKLSLSISGVAIEQFERYAPEVLESFKRLVATGQVEVLSETYHHSLSFFYSPQSFKDQVERHQKLVKEHFGVVPQVFRNTELSYDDRLGDWAAQSGFKAILCEGWHSILHDRSPNHVYKVNSEKDCALLLKNYRLSDDVAFRFSDREWREWPLTAEKFVHWADEDSSAETINLFMDYETFGEHQWEDSGIFHFIEKLPHVWLEKYHRTFRTPSETVDAYDHRERLSAPHPVTWADTERDLTAWLGNRMQQSAIAMVYDLEDAVIKSEDEDLLEDWRKLQTSDHFYYMGTKWFADGDVHAYFSPYASPYDAYLTFMNVMHDMRFRLVEKGVL